MTMSLWQRICTDGSPDRRTPASPRSRELPPVNEKTIAAIALRDGFYAAFTDTMLDAARWLELAAAQGAHLAVLPETINLLHRRDDSLPLEPFAFDDWQQA